jgi:hypothetical protein
MKKKSLSEKSKVCIPADFDFSQSVIPATLARIGGCHCSTVTRAIESGALEAVDGKIFLGDIANIRWLTRRLTSELKFMSSAQRDRVTVFLKKLENVPATAPGKPEGPAPYLPSLLEPCLSYEVGIKNNREFLPLIKLFCGERGSGIEVVSLVADITLAIDTDGKIEGIFNDDNRIDQLHYRLIDE